MDRAFAEADVIVESTYRTSPREHAPMEPEAGLAYFDEDDRLVVHAPHHHPFAAQIWLAEMLGIDKERVRVICPMMGGNFGHRGDFLHDGVISPPGYEDAQAGPGSCTRARNRSWGLARRTPITCGTRRRPRGTAKSQRCRPRSSGTAAAGSPIRRPRRSLPASRASGSSRRAPMWSRTRRCPSTRCARIGREAIRCGVRTSPTSRSRGSRRWTGLPRGSGSIRWTFGYGT